MAVPIGPSVLRIATEAIKLPDGEFARCFSEQAKR
jgi:hypothetical protein